MDTSVNGMSKDNSNTLNDTIGFPKDYRLGNNVLYNETEVREFHFVVNGKQPKEGEITDTRKLKFVAHRCIGADCFDEVAIEAPCSPEGDRKWSDPKSWSLEEEKDKR
jgi:hypothetical protein